MRWEQDGETTNYRLRNAVHRWPTPTSRDWKDGSYCPNVPVNGLLGRAVWRTPQARGGMAGGPQSPEKRKAGGHCVGLNDQAGGALNPPWVEWLMGWPLGWTACAPLEMDKFRAWLSAHGKS